MEKIKVLDINKSEPSFFAKFLRWASENHAFPFEVEHRDFFKVQDLETFQGGIFSLDESQNFFSEFKVCPAKVRDFGVFDFIFFEKNQWYPRLIFFDALRNFLVSRGKSLDIRAPAIVVSERPAAKVIASVLADLGFSEIYLVGDPGALLAEREDVFKTRLGIKINIINSDYLTDHSLSAGVIINTLDLKLFSSAINDLSYFNYIKEGGYVIDLNPFPRSNLFLEEAERAGLSILKPEHFWVAKSRSWLTHFFHEEKIRSLDLDLVWQNFLKK